VKLDFNSRDDRNLNRHRCLVSTLQYIFNVFTLVIIFVLINIKINFTKILYVGYNTNPEEIFWECLIDTNFFLEISVNFDLLQYLIL